MTSVPVGSAVDAGASRGGPAGQGNSASGRGSSAQALADELITRVQRALRSVVYARAATTGVSVACALAVVLVLVTRQWPLPGLSATTAIASLALFAGLVTSVLRARVAAQITRVRTALWIEEQLPAGFALVTLAERSEGTAARSTPQHTGRATARDADDASAQTVHHQEVQERLADAFLEAVGGSARADEQARLGLRALTIDRLRDPAAFGLVAAGLLVWLLVVPLVATSSLAPATAASAPADNTQSDVRVAPIGRWTVRVEPPAYSNLPVQQAGNSDEVRALSGSRLTVRGSGALPSEVTVRALTDSVSDAAVDRTGDAAASPVVTAVNDGWRVSIAVPPLPLAMRVSRGGATRLLLVEGFADTIPRVRLQTPARDSVLRRAAGALTLQATLHDDLGLADASFEMIVSSGEGERFTARTVRVAATRYARERDVTLRGTIDLDALQLGPGDIMHVRAVARDGNPAKGREAGASETRALRIARPAEYDSVSVEPAPPPEVDKSLLSQRMLLMLTEKLEQRRPRIAGTVLQQESRSLARDQARLRLAVGDAVFQRLSGESSAEHAHSVGDGHDHGVEAVGGKLAMPGGVSATGMLEEGDDSPVIGINKPLLEAYNAMWDAGRALELSDTKGAIPHMRVALAAIERARAASRLYLRGKPPVVILDLDKIRLAGKDTGVTSARALRNAITPRARAREARLLAAASLARSDVDAARDTAAVLRLESLGDAPAFAAALGAVIDRLRTGGDATDAFVRARRTLGGITRAPGAAWSRPGPP